MNKISLKISIIINATILLISAPILSFATTTVTSTTGNAKSSSAQTVSQTKEINSLHSWATYHQCMSDQKKYHINAYNNRTISQQCHDLSQQSKNKNK